MLEECHSKVDNWNPRPQTVYRRSVTTKLTTGANHYVKVNQTNSHTNKTTKTQSDNNNNEKKAKSTGANHYGKVNHIEANFGVGSKVFKGYHKGRSKTWPYIVNKKNSEKQAQITILIVQVLRPKQPSRRRTIFIVVSLRREASRLEATRFFFLLFCSGRQQIKHP